MVDSLNPRVMLEKGHLPVYYFPRADVAEACLAPTDHHTHCPHKGDASYWTVSAEVVDAILVDGGAEPKTRTQWSRD